jgi:hypothetical protein
MTNTLDTKLKIDSWDEKPYRELDDGTKFTRAEVALSGTGDGLTGARMDALMYYRPDGTSSYSAFLHVTGTLNGRTGSFLLQGEGGYDGTTASSHSRVVPGSGTGGLAGISATADSASTHADYPHMPLTLSYDVE